MNFPSPSRRHREQGHFIVEALTIIAGICVVASLTVSYLHLLGQARWGVFVTLAGSLVAGILTFTLLILIALLIGRLISWWLLRRQRNQVATTTKTDVAEIPTLSVLLTVWVSWLIVVILAFIDAFKDHPLDTLSFVAVTLIWSYASTRRPHRIQRQ